MAATGTWEKDPLEREQWNLVDAEGEEICSISRDYPRRMTAARGMVDNRDDGYIWSFERSGQRTIELGRGLSVREAKKAALAKLG